MFQSGSEATTHRCRSSIQGRKLVSRPRADDAEARTPPDCHRHLVHRVPDDRIVYDLSRSSGTAFGSTKFRKLVLLGSRTSDPQLIRSLRRRGRVDCCRDTSSV
jgi:hypothetical protein